MLHEPSEFDNKLLRLDGSAQVTGFLQYLDEQAIQYTVLYELTEDLHLVGTQFSWAMGSSSGSTLPVEAPLHYLWQFVNRVVSDLVGCPTV